MRLLQYERILCRSDCDCPLTRILSRECSLQSCGQLIIFGESSLANWSGNMQHSLVKRAVCLPVLVIITSVSYICNRWILTCKYVVRTLSSQFAATISFQAKECCSSAGIRLAHEVQMRHYSGAFMDPVIITDHLECMENPKIKCGE